MGFLAVPGFGWTVWSCSFWFFDRSSGLNRGRGKRRNKIKKKVVREVAIVEVAVLGSSGVSRVYRRIVRYDFQIGTILPFFHCELRFWFFLGILTSFFFF